MLLVTILMDKKRNEETKRTKYAKKQFKDSSIFQKKKKTREEKKIDRLDIWTTKENSRREENWPSRYFSEVRNIEELRKSTEVKNLIDYNRYHEQKEQDTQRNKSKKALYFKRQRKLEEGRKSIVSVFFWNSKYRKLSRSEELIESNSEMGTQGYAKKRRRSLQLDVEKKIRKIDQYHQYYENKKERKRREDEARL